MRFSINSSLPVFYFNCISILALLFGATACGDDAEKQAAAYSQNYDELFTFGLSINDFANATGVRADDIIKMRYGLMAPSEDLTGIMSELNEKFRNHERNEAFEMIEDMSKDKPDIKIDRNTIKVSQDALENKYRVSAMSRNERFDSSLPDYVGAQINHNIKNYIDSKFAWYRFPANAWDYVSDGKEDLHSQYKKSFDDILSSEKVNGLVVNRFNAYSSLLTAEFNVLFGKELNLPELKDVKLDNATSIADAKVLDNTVARTATDLTDTILTIIEEIGIAIILWFVFGWLSNQIANKYASWVLDYDFENYGFWRNTGIFALNMFNAYCESEEQRKLDRIKRWTSWIITIAFLVGSYYWVIRPQIEIENNLLSQIEVNTANYVSRMDVPILSYFNSVLDNNL